MIILIPQKKKFQNFKKHSILRAQFRERKERNSMNNERYFYKLTFEYHPYE